MFFVIAGEVYIGISMPKEKWFFELLWGKKPRWVSRHFVTQLTLPHKTSEN